MPFPLPSSDWKYKVSEPTPINFTITIPGSLTLLQMTERGYIISLNITLSGSSNCQNFTIQIIEGILGGALSVPIVTVTPSFLNSMGRAGFDNMPTVTLYDTVNNNYSIQWDPKFPIPFRGLTITVTAPDALAGPPTANIALSYLFAIEVSTMAEVMAQC